MHPARARRQLDDLLRRENWPGDNGEVLLAFHEALINAQRHGGGALRAQAAVGGSTVVLTVWDCGPGFDPTPYVRRPPDLMAERGRGFWLINQLATECEVRRERDGTAVVMRFERS